MTSLTAGSPSCNCKNPDTCIHSLTLKMGNKTFTYKQKDFFDSIKVINKGSAPLSLNLSMQGKTCVSHNPECPKGLIYDQGKQSTLKTFTQGSLSYDVDYNRDELDFIHNKSAMNFVSEHILMQSALDWLPASKYVLRVGQCEGEPFVNKEVSFIDGVKKIFDVASRDRLMSFISVYPGYSWDVGLSISLSEEINEYDEHDLKKQQRADNRAAGMPQRDVRGWTKRPKYSITDALDINGSLSYTLGQHPKYELSRKIKAEFKRKAKELTLLQDSIKAIDLVGDSLSTNEGKGTKFKILETDIIFPSISINGGAELVEDEKTNSVYMKGKVSVGLTPLIGVKIKLDLLQAIAAMYASEKVADVIRQELARREKLVQQGKNSAYAGLTLDLIVKGELDLGLAFESDLEKKWNWRVEGQNEVKLSLDLDASARAGVRFDIIEGVFAVEGSFEVSGKAKTEGIMAFDLTPQNRVEMIFYHHGVKIELGVSYNGGIVSSSQDADVSEDGDGSRMELDSEGLSVMKEKKKGDKREWILHEKLTKDKSPYRVIIL